MKAFPAIGHDLTPESVGGNQLSYKRPSYFLTPPKKSGADAAAGAGARWSIKKLGLVSAGLFYETAVESSYWHQRHHERVRAETGGTGGVNITQTLLNTADSLQGWWQDQSYMKTHNLIHDTAIIGDGIYSYSGWDVPALMASMKGQQLSFANGIVDWAPRTVTIDNGTNPEVHYAHEVNYFLWGVANALEHNRTGSVSREEMRDWVIRYRKWGFGDATQYYLDRTKHDGSKAGRAAWAEAGWDYVMTDVLTPPTDYRLPKATANTAGVYGSNYFTVRLGPDELTHHDLGAYR